MLHLIEATKTDEYYVVNIDLKELSIKEYIEKHLDTDKQWKATSIGDERYTVKPEFRVLSNNGRNPPRPVVRFCGDFIGSRISEKAAFYAAMSHKAERECTAQSAVDFLSTVQ